MEKPKFRLQVVLDHRRELVDRTRLQLAELQQRQAAEETQLLALRAAECTVLARLDECQRAGGVALSDVQALTLHLEQLTARIYEQVGRVAQLSQEIAVVQERLHEQAKNLKALEKLRERHLAELDQEGRRQERRETGEIAALQFRRFQGVGP